MDVVSRACRNSRIQPWKKDVAQATRRAGVKDDEGNLVMQIVHSESPLKEFTDAAYRKGSEEFDPPQPATGPRGLFALRNGMRYVGCIVFSFLPIEPKWVALHRMLLFIAA